MKSNYSANPELPYEVTSVPHGAGLAAVFAKSMKNGRMEMSCLVVPCSSLILERRQWVEVGIEAALKISAS